jgi:hypothetical protein
MNYQTLEAERERGDDILDDESEIRTFSLFRASLHSQMTLSRPVGMAGGLQTFRSPKMSM